MSTTTERAAAALELLPEAMREPAIAYLFEQAEKFRALKQMIAEGMEDVASGHVSEWNFEVVCGRHVLVRLNVPNSERFYTTELIGLLRRFSLKLSQPLRRHARA